MNYFLKLFVIFLWLVSALNFSSIRNITDYDFRIAIVEAIEELKLRNHPAGSVLLILKSGTGLNWTSNQVS